jgi:transketolase C-terminal domain/subunit
MEFKVISPKKEKSLEETAQNALEQIKEKNYKEELIEVGISENNIKAYGFAFEGKNVLILD